MGKYLLENIHAQFPEARLGIIVGSRGSMIRDLFSAYPWLEVIEVNRRHPFMLLQLWLSWRGSDLVVTQYAGKPGGKFSLASKLFARLLARRGALVGFADASSINTYIYSTVVPFDRAVAPTELERGVLEAIGVAVTLPCPTLVGASKSDVWARFGIERDQYVVAHLFSGGKTRALSPQKQKALVAYLAENLPQGVDIVVTGNTSEKEAAAAATGGTRARVVAEQTSLQEMIELIAGSRGVVAVDTGVAHMAAQLGAPLVVLTSCLGAHWWGSRQYPPQAPIVVLTNKGACTSGHRMVAYPPCLNDIDPRNVESALAVKL